MKHRIGTKALSALLALVMVVGMVPATAISAFAEGVPETLVTSLTELYSGNETRAREDLEALNAAGLLGDDGKLVDLDIRAGGESAELSALAERIANGEEVGEITVNGSAATAEQITQIQSVNAAIEIAALLDEEIDVTDEHVENLESLLTGIADGSVDLENALRTGELSLQSEGDATLQGAGDGELPETIQKQTIPADYRLPVSTLKNLSLLTLSQDGKSYIAPYFDSNGFDPNHEFEFQDQDLEYKNYYYVDHRFSGHFNISENESSSGNSYWGDDVDNYLANKTDNGYDKFVDWSNMQWGVGEQDGQQALTIVLPFFTTDEALQKFANLGITLRECGENGNGLELALPEPYGTITVRKYMPNLYFSFSHSAISAYPASKRPDTEEFYDNADTRGEYVKSWFDTSKIRYPAYLIEQDEKPIGLATCMAVRPNFSSMVRRDKVNIYLDPWRDTYGGYTGDYHHFNYCKDYPYVPDWNAVVDTPREQGYYGYERRVDDLGYSYFYYYPLRLSYHQRVDENNKFLDEYTDYGEYDFYLDELWIGTECPRARRLKEADLFYYVAPAIITDKTKFINRTADYEPAEGGFIKLKDPEKADFSYLYPGDPANPQNQYDIELLATEDLYQVMIGGGVIYREKDLDLRFTWQFSDRQQFSTGGIDFSSFANNSFLNYERNDAGEVVLTTKNASNTRCSIGVTATNGGANPYDISFPTKVYAKEGSEPYLMIPRSSQVRETLTDISTSILFASNISQQNSGDTVFSAKLYEIEEDQIGNGVPEGATPVAMEGWGEFPSAASAPVTSIPVPGLTKAGTYAVSISTSYSDGTNTIPFSATAYLKVKNAPAKVSLNKLTSYSAVKDNIPDIKYTVTSRADSVEVKYTIQPAGETVSEMQTASGGTIPFDPGEIIGTKKAYIITVYARNSAEDPWSTDSMLLTVYNDIPVKLVVKDVVFGEIGGTTGGVAEGSSVTSIEMDNSGVIEELISKFNNQEPGYSFDDLRAAINLQKLISANYGNGTMGIIADKLQWSSKKADGKASDEVTLNYREKDAYSDIRDYNYTFYIPTSDFLVTATDDVSADAPVTVTAIHAATGLPVSVKVTVNTLQDKFYMFRFNPKAETDVIYTNGAGVERKLKTNANGELAVYEPDGITGDIVTMSKKGGDTYVGTLSSSDLISGEQNIAKLELYPCNNFTLRKVSDCTLTFLKPDGKPYEGKVTLRGGVYAGGEYCPDAKIRTEKDINSHQYLREDIEFTTNADGKTTVYFDPTQFTSESGKTWANGLQYVFEYRFEDTYQPGYVLVNGSINNPAESIVNLKSMRGSGKVPTIVRQDYQQYQSNGKKTAYTRNVMDYTDNIGISPNFNKSELYTDIVMLGEKVGTDENGYSNFAGDNATSFALYTTDGKKLTGQTDLSEAKTITKLSDLNNANFFVFPFSAVPMLRSTYTMTDANMTADGITDQGENPTPTARIKAVFTRRGLTVRTINMPFGITNVSHQPDLNSNQGATAVGKEVRNHLRETTDIGAIFRSINVNDMIRKGFVFLGNLAGKGGDNPINLMILPTQDPATFRIIAFVGANQRSRDNDDGVSVNFNSQDLAEDMTKFRKEMEELDKKKDKENNSGGSGSMQFNFYGTIILEAHAGVTDGKWNIAFRGGNVGTNIKGKYEWGQTFFCGPYPAFISFEVGFHADLEVAFGNKSAVRAMLLDAALGVSVEAFAGLGFDLSIVAIQLGIYGQIGADVNFLLLTPSDADPSTGTKLTISGEIGIKLKVKLLFISYSKKFASTGFNWTKKWKDYDAIKNNATLMGTTESGRAYTMYLFEDGSTIVEIEGRAEPETRDYLELAERTWTGGANSGRRLLRSASPIANAITNVQTNSYPYSHPAFTDDGELFLYVSDNEESKKVVSVVSYAVKSGDGYENTGSVDTSEDNVLADLDVVASGTKTNAFAAWVKQIETPKRADKNAEVTNDELGMMFNATEIYASSYNGTAWTTTRLTDNTIADMSPTVASSGSKAIVAWRSMNASSMTADGTGVPDITAMFDLENNINYRVYDGSEWKTAQVAYNGNAGTVNAIDSAMLSDGTAILVYTVRTDEDVTSTETFYTVIDAEGNTVTTGRLTSDSYTDTNAQVTAVNDTDGGYFVLGWYSEHDAGEGSTAAEYDADGKVTATKAVVAHDIRLARINANGSYDIDFPESIGGSSSADISSDFHFSAPANNTALTNVSVVWSQRKDSDKAEDAGKYELNAVRFFQADGVTGLTAPTDIAETDKNYTIDRFDTYTDAAGAIHAIILGTDYSTIEGISVYDSIDLDAAAGKEVTSNSDSPNNLEILDGEAISSLKLATGTFPETAADVSAGINISEVIPGFTTPVQFTVTNTGTGKLTSVTATVGSQNKEFTGLNLLPNQSATLLMSYSVPEGAVSDTAYSVTSGDTVLGSGTLALNRPDVGISGIKLLQEHDGVRDIQVTLGNSSEIPLAGSGKTVKLAFYKDPFHESMIGSEISINADDYSDIDARTYTTVQTLNVTDIVTLNADGEIPEDGITVYARAWVELAEGVEEPNTYNNDNFISFTGLLARNNGEKLTTDTSVEENEGGYTVYADIRNNSMKETSVGTPVALLLDAEGNIVAQKNFQNDSLTLTKEKTSSLSTTFTAQEIGDKTPAQAAVGTAYTVTFDVNGGTGTFESVQTDLDGHITLPTTTPTPPTGGTKQLFFGGWYTDATNGDQITADYTFTSDTTVYAHYVNHQHDFTYRAEGGATITATCGKHDGCTLEDSNYQATLTIAAPESNTYTGSAIPVIITDTNGIQGDAKVLYAAKGENGTYGEASETVPLNVGTYRASITLGTGDGAETANVEYEIKNAALTNVRASQNGTLTYTGETQTPQVATVATAVNNQTVTFTYSLTEDGRYGDMPAFTNANEGSPTTVFFKASAPYHDTASGSFKVTVNKATPAAPAEPAPETATANKIVLTEVEGCEYSMDGETWQDSTTFTGLRKSTQYTFYQRIKGDNNHNPSPASSAQLTTGNHDHEWGNFTSSGATITATCKDTDNGHGENKTATMVITAPTLTTYGQTGEGISAEATVTNNIDGFDNPTIVYKKGNTVLDAAPTDAGTYTANITLENVDVGNEQTGNVTASVTYTIDAVEIKGILVKLDNYKYDVETAPVPKLINDDEVVGGNFTLVQGDSTKTVTYYYQATAFLKSQTDDVSTLDTTPGVYKTITSTTFEPGTHYVLAVVTGGNYSNVPYVTQSVFGVTQNTDKERTAPTAPTVDGTKVTVAEADREKSLEYSLDGQTWLPVELDENGEFTAEWANPVTDAALLLRETADESYAKPSASATGTATITTTTFTVTYDANGGIKAPDAVTVTSDRTVTVSSKVNMTRKGYTFKTWNTSADGSGTEVKAGDKLESGTTLYAQWEANTYKVRFNANGGKNTIEELEFTYNVAQALTANAFERAEYNFLGWSLSANGSVQYQDQQSVKNIAESGTVTLYAVWAKDLYNVNGTIKSAETGKISIELVQGNNSFGSTEVPYDTADEEVSFTLTGIPAGTYNLVATQGDVTMTAAVIITDDHVALELITMPTGNTSSVVDVKGDDAPAIVVGGLDDVAAAEEIDGRKVTVTITAETQNEAEAGEADEAILKESRAQNAMFIDFTVTKTISNNGNVESVETMTETKSLIELLVPFNFSGKTGIKLYRYHGGAVQELKQAVGEETEDGTYRLDQKAGLIYVYTSSFSTYAITYSNYSYSSNTPSYTASVSGENETISVSANVSGNTATVTAPTDAQMEKIVGKSKETGEVTIDLSSLPEDVTAVSIPAKTVKAIDEAMEDTGEGLTIKLPTGNVTFEPEALASIAAQTTGKDLKLNVEPITESKLNAKQKEAIAELDVQAVYDIYLTSNSKRIADFGGGKATVEVTYKLKDGQQPGGIVAWYVADDGKKVNIAATPTEKTVKFTATHFSNYVVAYDETLPGACAKDDDCPMTPFTDLDKSSWYHDGVHWALENSVMNGVGNNLFDPNGTTSRAMIVTMLYRMEGDPEATSEMPFDDVPAETWYTDAVAWAEANGIVNGVGNNKFAPNTDLTREQLVTILQRYANYKGIDTSAGEQKPLKAFDDTRDISDWAVKSMRWAVDAGIINGTGNGKISPKTDASRAQVATMLMRYCTLVTQ